MTRKTTEDHTPEQVANLIEKHGSQRKAAEAIDKSRGYILRRLEKLSKAPLEGRVKAFKKAEMRLPSKNRINRYICTSAQNNTVVHPGLWRNLKALARYYGAEILVSTFTYNKSAYGRSSVKRGTFKPQRHEDWYAECVTPYIRDERIVLAPGLEWCGEMNILPTAVRPLSGLESYTGRASAIIPHAKIALESVASGKFEATKFNYTTGTVTMRNYVKKKAGLKAEHHHAYGALLVEVDHRGNWWCRQLNGDSEGVIYDLDLRAKDGEVTHDHRAEAITWGDIHQITLDTEVFAMGWQDPDSMMQVLKPKHQFMHDLLDFKARNGHIFKKKHWLELYRNHVQGVTNVRHEVEEALLWLNDVSQDDCLTVIVDSNHNKFLDEWLQIGDFRKDPENAEFFLEASLAAYRQIKSDPYRPVNLMEWAWIEFNGVATEDRVRFLDEDESFVICPDANGGIECGVHGHAGLNGARGSVPGFTKVGRKINIGHVHSTTIMDGVYAAGISGDMDQGYNKGMSSWSHSHIVTYPNGKRAIITMWDGKWKA